jgi:23S rRNA (guanine1835-N2)-methyltransferase
MKQHVQPNSNTLFESAMGNLQLQRFPINQNQDNNLQAWDAADELMLEHLQKDHPLTQNNRLLIVNDNFGALSCTAGLSSQPSDQHIICWNDSFVTHSAINHNATINELTTPIASLKSTQNPTGHFDIVCLKIPKTLALLEYQLAIIRNHITPTSLVVASSMAKYLRSSHIALFEKYIGATHTSLAHKKARLIFSSLDESITDSDSPYPSSYINKELQLTLTNHANVFSRDKLDIGSRFLLQHFDQLPAVLDNSNTIVDLGCGDGVLGIMAQKKYPKACVYFTDESYMAVASAQSNYQQACNLSAIEMETKANQFIADDCLSSNSIKQADLILCNPPFHQGNTVSDHIAWKMLKQSKDLLSTGGKIWVVGNRHLNYHQKIKSLMGNCTVVDSDKKFVILEGNKQ